jgi:hypothetical protein
VNDNIELLCSKRVETDLVKRWEMIRNITVGRRASGHPLASVTGAAAAGDGELYRGKSGVAATVVDEIDPSIGVIRFDVPGVGGSPLPARPYRFTDLVRAVRSGPRSARLRPGRHAGRLVGRGAGAAVRVVQTRDDAVVSFWPAR